ncbi:MAG: FAD-binding oxidoreductase [Anaerolineales bacterium]
MKATADVVICGAGIGGVATAYFLTTHYGIRDVGLVDPRPPLSLTSDKSTECYRNWWPGPGDAMVQMMNRSIDLMEQMAAESGNYFHLNRRGYLYTTTREEKIADLEGFAREASSLGAGDYRVHTHGGKHNYQPHEEGVPIGADLILDRKLIRQGYPYLSHEVVGVLWVHRAGWLSAQQYGMWMLSQAREYGARLVEDEVIGVETRSGKVYSVQLASGNEIRTPVFVNAAGPLLGEVAAMLGVTLPVFHELHMKASIKDTAGAVGRDAPLLIDVDPQTLHWSEDERVWLMAGDENRWLLDELPSGAHVRPEGASSAQSILMLWDLHTERVAPELPAPLDPFYPELAVRGLSKMLPGMAQYVQRMPKPYIDSGYYTKTEENRPLAGPMPVPGSYLIGAMGGFGIMASAALGELVAAQIAGETLPNYAPRFDLGRYKDPKYVEMLSTWGDSWQL